MAFGRPTSYDDEMLEAANWYAENYQECGDVVPSVVGLCAHINRSKSVVYEWIKDPNKPDFLDIYNKIQEGQERGLVNGGLAGGFAPAVTKMLLTKHGYSDKIEQDHTSSDGSMTPKSIHDFYADNSVDDE